MAVVPQKVNPVPTNMTFVRLFSRLNVLLYRVSGGAIMGKMQGTPICLVTMTRRKSGRRTTIPLMYNPAGDTVALVASLGGAPKSPAWYYNVTSDPNVEVQVGWKRRKMVARQASAKEKAALWPAIVANYPAYQVYQQRTERDIPVIICTPVGS